MAKPNTHRESELTGAWLSYYHIIKQDIERLDYRLFKMTSEAIALGANEEKCAEFIAKHVPELIEHVAKQREEREGRKP